MVSATWPKLPDLIEALLHDASQFGFYQAMRLIEASWRERGRFGEGLDGWVRIAPSRHLRFPPADVRRCDMDEDGRLFLQANFMGLYGVDASLPHYFLDRAAADDKQAQRLRQFLDMFNHRFYVLLYQAWSLGHALRDGAASPYGRTAAALAGSTARDEDFACHAGLLNWKRRSTAGLAAVMRRLLGGVPVTVTDRQPTWVDLPPRGRLGGENGPCLGGDGVLGDRIVLAGGAVSVELGPMSVEHAAELLPGSDGGKRLTEVVRRYLEDAWPFEVRFRILPASTACHRLGEENLRLGWATWLGNDLASEYRIRVGGSRYGATDPRAGSTERRTSNKTKVA